MRIIILAIGIVLIAASAIAETSELKESDKVWGNFGSGVRVGLGLADMKGEEAAEYRPGLAFTVGMFTSFGWRSRIQLQPEVNFVARNATGRDELTLLGTPSGLFRDTSYELSEVQAGLMLKLGSPRYTPVEASTKNRRYRGKEKKWMPYLALGTMWGRKVESKRVIKLDSPGTIAKSDPWLKDEKLHLEWVAAIGYEFMRYSGGGVGLEFRWQVRDLLEETGLSDSVKLSMYTLQLGLLF